MGAFMNVVVLGAAMFGDDAVIKALDLGEVNGLGSYEAGLVALDETTRSRVAHRFGTAQRRTMEKMRQLAEA